MTRRLHNPELDRLVQEMNRLVDPELREELSDTDERPRELDSPSLREVAAGEPLGRLLQEMVRKSASDLLLVAGSPLSAAATPRLPRPAPAIPAAGWHG